MRNYILLFYMDGIIHALILLLVIVLVKDTPAVFQRKLVTNNGA